MRKTSCHVSNIPDSRASLLDAAKKASAKGVNTQARVQLGEETFVYEGGRLAEYEYTLPPEYLEYPEKD